VKTILSASAAVMLVPSGAFAFAHLWKIQEVYSNATGSLQFIEFLDNSGGGEFFLSSAVPLQFQINGVTVNSMPFDNTTATDGSGDLSTAPPGTTLNRTFLVATANFQGLFGFAPDYIIPANFMQLTGANRTVEFPSGPDEVSLTSLPLDGVMSLNGNVGNSSPSSTSINSQASPRNFAGQTVNIPEPGSLSTLVLGGAALGGLAFLRRRRS
jgi:serralysin